MVWHRCCGSQSFQLHLPVKENMKIWDLQKSWQQSREDPIQLQAHLMQKEAAGLLLLSVRLIYKNKGDLI